MRPVCPEVVPGQALFKWRSGLGFGKVHLVTFWSVWRARVASALGLFGLTSGTTRQAGQLSVRVDQSQPVEGDRKWLAELVRLSGHLQPGLAS